ncbi:hypothetical protein O6H91_08G027600 [Diphasiastrum complanatum]|uniref:Uncharacterized protein n=1 Tax=Diphasiastrum complanatum TaxID=34168 RepID=A0ACC2CW42_DIPCM|nr:hypothetical protein O6H91_08G027600 [Diphasiastrum complanatum]
MPSPFASMPSSSYRDRTTEFHAVVDRLKKSHASATNSQSVNSNGHLEGFNKLNGPQTSGSVQSEFNRKASQIGLSIHQTSLKLSKLAKLAKRTSMFDDPLVEIQELTAVIKQDIQDLNGVISDLQVICDARNDGASRSKHSSEHSSTVVDNLKSRLMNTTKEFKDVLTMRTENIKTHENRRQLFSATVSKERGNPFARQPPVAVKGATNSSTTPPPWGNGSTSSELFSSRRRTNLDNSSSSSSQAEMQVLLPVQETSYMQSRAEALQNVESTISELSNIFTQLATMVAEQGEMAIRIDENMDDTLVNVEGAQGALLKYLNRISSNRWLILKIFFVLVVFLLIFVFFVA